MRELAEAVAVRGGVQEFHGGRREYRIRGARTPAPVVGRKGTERVGENLHHDLILFDARAVPGRGADEHVIPGPDDVAQTVVLRAAVHQKVPQIVENIHRIVDHGTFEHAGGNIGPLEEEVEGRRGAETIGSPKAPDGEIEIARAAFPVHEHEGRRAAYVPFDRSRAAVHEKLARLLLGRREVLLGGGYRGNRLGEPRLGGRLRAARDGEPRQDGKKNPSTNRAASGHMYSSDQADLRGERSVAYVSITSTVKRKALDRAPGRLDQALPAPPVRPGRSDSP